LEKCGTVVPQSNFQKRVIRQRIDCNTGKWNGLVTSTRIAEYVAEFGREQSCRKIAPSLPYAR
jgi:hypothetical protein